MKQELIVKISGAFVLLILIVMSAYTLLNTFPSLWDMWLSYDKITLKENPDRLFAEAENNITYAIPNRLEIRDIYSRLAVLQGKREGRNFYILKDDNGYLYRGNYYQSMSPNIMDYAKRIRRLREETEKNGGKLIFVGTPERSTLGNNTVYSGYPLDRISTLNMDELFSCLYANEVDSLDLGLIFTKSNLTYKELYYKTDSRWTTIAAFLASDAIVNALDTNFGIMLDPENIYSNLDHYHAITYPSAMQGDYGRSVGISFGGLDDYTVLLPNFETNFDRHARSASNVSGDFETALLDYAILNDPQKNSYLVYLSSDDSQHFIVNKNIPDAPKILLIGDSNFIPVTAFLSTMCSEITMVSPLSARWNGNDNTVSELIQENSFDCVLVACQPENIGDSMFAFYKK
ncbi:hypothetical protein LQZ18_03155 [Lachnospiraceae bacterium ZAX-1]